MTESEALAFRVMERVSLHGPVPLEELNRLLPDCTWNQVFATVDRLSREGRLEIHHPDRCAYIVRLGKGPRGPTGTFPETPACRASVQERRLN